MTISKYLLEAAERYQDYRERGNANMVSQLYWVSVQQHLQLNWPGAYDPHWNHQDRRIELRFHTPAAMTWFWLQHS
jgi:hypothetical protein